MKKYSAALLLVLLLLLVVAASPALAQDRPVRLAGEITAIDSNTDQLLVKPRYRDPFTVQTSTETEFWRKVGQDGLEPITFEDLIIGDHLQIGGTWDGEVLMADKVIVLPESGAPPKTINGIITRLDPGSGALAVQPREGDPVEVHTFDETHFYRLLRHGRLLPIAFEDLEIGNVVKVQGAMDGEILLARRVTVMPLKPGDHPPATIAGKIGRIDDSAIFSLNRRQGEAVKVVTDNETKFYRTGRWGRLEPISFEELAVGQKVLVQGARDGESFDAGLVIVMPGPGDAPADITANQP